MADAKQKLLIDVAVKNQAALGGVAAGLANIQRSSFSAGKALKFAAAGIAAIVSVKLIKGIVSTTAKFEDLRTTLASVTGSAEKGTEAFSFINEFATKTQFSVEDLTKTFIKLKAAGIEPTEKLMTTFTDTAAITSDQVGSLEAVTDLYARTVSGGLGLEEIQRLGDRGVPVLAILEDKLGLTRNQISEFGKTAEGAKQIVDAFGEGIQERFGGATQNLLGNLSVQFSNLGIALKTSADVFGQGLAPAIKEGTKGLTDFITENEELVRTMGEFVGDVLILFLKGLGAIVKGLMQIVSAAKTATGWIKNLIGLDKDLIKLDDKRVKNLRLMHQGYKVLTPAIEKTTDALVETKDAWDEAFDLEQISASHNAMHDMMNTVIEDTEVAKASWRDYTDGIQGALLTQEKAMAELRTAGENAYNGLTDAVTDFVMTGKFNFKDFANSVIRDLVRIAVQAAITWGIKKAAGTFLGIPFLAEGGPLKAGQPAIVGEEGPELFVPNTSGTVVPSGSTGAAIGGEVTVNFNISTVDADSFDDLLLSRKGLIIGTIQQAFRQQGRRFA